MGMFVVAPASSFHHNHHHTTHEPSIVSDPHHSMNMGVGVGVIPLLTAGPCLNAGAEEDSVLNGRARSGGIQFWQNSKPTILDNNDSGNLLQSVGAGGGGAVASTAAALTCQDCGNQAKKDCSHRRCRTCCKSRGFDCATHVKSTWVPAARRRERQLMSTAAGSSGSSVVKKPRLVASQTTSHTSTSNNTPPRSFDTGSSHQDASFKERLPGQVRAPAVFKCVRVSAVEDGGEDEYAYQAVVKINGHVFKGLLYNQGVQSSDGYPNISELHLGGRGTSGGGGGRDGGSSTSPILDPPDVYAAAGGGMLGGSSYGNPIN